MPYASKESNLRSVENLNLSVEVKIDELQSLSNDQMNIIIESEKNDEEDNTDVAQRLKLKRSALKKRLKLLNNSGPEKVLAYSNRYMTKVSKLKPIKIKFDKDRLK
jgi:hypothetical protein